MITTINTGPADGWHLVITARAGLARLPHPLHPATACSGGATP